MIDIDGLMPVTGMKGQIRISFCHHRLGKVFLKVNLETVTFFLALGVKKRDSNYNEVGITIGGIENLLSILN
jgi:hypothetical protein